MVMVLNQRDDVKDTYFTEENNQADSQTTIVNTWINDAERKQFDQEKNNLFVQITNLSPSPVDLKVTISSRTSSPRNKKHYIQHHHESAARTSDQRDQSHLNLCHHSGRY